MKIKIRFQWKELSNGLLLDPERDNKDYENKILFSYVSREEAIAALMQYLHLDEWNGREFVLLEVVGLE